MSVVFLPQPSPDYNPQNEAQTRRIIAQLLSGIPSATVSVYTVATLPTAPRGSRAFVIDATAPTFLAALTGGGTVFCPVLFNGAAWVSG